MSCCNGNCGCGPACKCGTSCSGCKMYPDFAEGSSTSTTMILGLAPTMGEFAGFEMATGTENDGCGCKCGDNCNCNPCKCGK